MKKLLIVGLSVAMGTALALGITACGKKGNSDADTAKEAIKTVTNLHASVGTETPTSYKVTGATRVGTQVVTVEWSVTSTYEGYADYVSVGEKGADQQVAINITQHEEDAIDYTLTASVTVGKATETKDFSHTIPAGGKIYTPSEAKTLAGTLDADAYYMEEGVVTAINVKGYVVAIEGGWNTQYNELQKVYIGDTAETAKTDALYVYYIDSDPVYMTKEFDVEVGDLITVRGALQNYKGNTPELTYNGTGESRIDPVIVAPIQKAPKTDAQILDDAKNALKINEYYSATGDYDLPVPIKDVTATWALEGGNNEYVKVEDGKLSVLKLPDTETSYKLTATLSYGTATPVKAEFTIKLGKLALTHAGTEADPFTPAEALTIAATLADKQYYSDTNGVKAVYVKGKVVDVGTWSGGNYNNYNKVYIIAEDAYTANATKDTTGAILVYRIASDPQLTEGTIKHGDTLLLLCGIQRYGETYELGSTKGSSDSSNSATLVTYTSGGGSVTPGPGGELSDPTKGTEIVAEGATVFDFSDVQVAEAEDYNDITEAALLAAFDNFTGLTVEESKVYAGNNTTGGPAAYQSTGGFLRMGSSKANGTLTLTFTKDINKIQILCLGWSATDTIAIEGFNPATIGNTDQVAYTFELTEAVKSFTITTAKRALIFKIAVTFTDGSETPPTPEHVHNYTYTYDTENGWQHKGHCDVSGCTQPDVTEECTPENNQCPDCKHDFTQKEILDKLFASKADSTMKGTYSLTGKVLRIDTAYDSTYKNVTFTMKVDDKEIQAFREKSTHSATVKAGDTVTVQGTLKHYYTGVKEFDAGCVITNLTTGELTNAEKVSEALRAVTLPASTAKDITLPEPTIEGVTFAWASNTETSIKVEGNTLKVTQTTEQVSVKITLTATCGTDATATKEFTVIVDAKLAEGSQTAEMKYSGSTTNMSGNNDANTIFKLDASIFTITSEKTNSGNNHVGLNKDGTMRLYKNETATLHIEIAATYKIVSIKVTLASNSQQKMDALKVVVGSTTVTGTGIDTAKTVATFAVDGTKVSLSNTCTASSSNQIYIASIEIVYAPASATVQAPAQVAILPVKEF